VPKADDKAKSGAATGEVEGSCWHLEVEDDQNKLVKMKFKMEIICLRLII
jgi:hypothetical protein